MRYRDSLQSCFRTIRNNYHLYRCVLREYGDDDDWDVDFNDDHVTLTHYNESNDYAIIEYDGSGVSIECYDGDSDEKYNSYYLRCNIDQVVINTIHVFFK